MEDVRRGGDRVAAQHHLCLGELPRHDDPVGQGGVAGDLPVLAGLQLGRGHLVGGAERFRRLAVVPARPQCQHVGLGDLGLAGELLADERLAVLEFAAVHPGQQPQGEHVLRPRSVLLRRADRLHGTQGQGRHRDGLHDVVGQLVGLERVGLIADLRQVSLGELVGVRDDQSATREVADVGLECSRIHRDENVGSVARSEDVEVRDLDLERRHSGQRALWCADLGGVIRLRRKVVAKQCGFGGESVTRQLHAVTGVTGEPDDHLLELLPRRRSASRAGTVDAAVLTHGPLPFTLGQVAPHRVAVEVAVQRCAAGMAFTQFFCHWQYRLLHFS